MSKIYQKTHPAGKNAGFTLIELLVVVLIIGILAAVALPQYTKAVEKSRAAEGLAMMRSLSTGVEEYVMANGEMPTSFDQLSVVPKNVTPDASGCIQGKSFKFCIQNGPRLQSWSLKKNSYGFIWYSSMHDDIGIAGKQFYCFEEVGSEANKMGICRAIGGKDQITSPTSGASYVWFALD